MELISKIECTIKFIVSLKVKCNEILTGAKKEGDNISLKDSRTLLKWIDNIQALFFILKSIRYGDSIGCVKCIPAGFVQPRTQFINVNDAVAARIRERGEPKENEKFSSLSCYQLEIWEKGLLRKKDKFATQAENRKKGSLRLQITNLVEEVDAILRDVHNFLRYFTIKCKDTKTQLKHSDMNGLDIFSSDFRVFFVLSCTNGKVNTREFKPTNDCLNAKVFEDYTSLYNSAFNRSTKRSNRINDASDEEDDKENRENFCQKVAFKSTSEEIVNSFPFQNKVISNISNELQESGKSQSNPTPNELARSTHNPTPELDDEINVSEIIQYNENENKSEDFTEPEESIMAPRKKAAKKRKRQETKENDEDNRDNSSSSQEQLNSNLVPPSTTLLELGNQAVGSGLSRVTEKLTEETMAAAVILGNISGREETTIEENDNNVAMLSIQDSIAQNGPTQTTPAPAPPPTPTPTPTLPPNAPAPTPTPVLSAHAGATLLPSPLLTLTQDAQNQNVPISEVTYSLRRYDEVTGEHTESFEITLPQANQLYQRYQTSRMELERHISTLQTDEIYDKSKELISYAAMVNSLGVAMQKQSQEDIENAFVFYTYASLKRLFEGKQNVKFDELLDMLKGIDEEIHKALRRCLGNAIYDELKSFRFRILRKIRSAYFSLYLKFEGLDQAIVTHCNSAHAKKLKFFKPDPKLDRRSSMSSSAVDQSNEVDLVKAFSELGEQHLSFEEKDYIHKDMKKRKKSDANISFSERTSFRNPQHLPRGRKPGAPYSSSQPIQKTARTQKTPARFKDMVLSGKIPVSRKNQVQESKEEGELKEAKEPDAEDVSKQPENIIRHGGELEEHSIFGEEDNEDEEDDLVVRCNETGLKALAKAVRDRLPDITAACQKRNPVDAIDMKLEVVISEIFEQANVSQEYLPLKSATGKCHKCSATTRLRECLRPECNGLIFCPDHVGHCKVYRHNVVEKELNHNDDREIFIYGNIVCLESSAIYSNGVKARKSINDGQKIAPIHFLYITEEFFNRAKSVDTLAPAVTVLGENYIFIPRNIKIIDMHRTANFIRNANRNQQPNCQLTYGTDEAFDNFIFVKATRDINQGEELFLDYGGIDSSGLVSLRNRYEYKRTSDILCYSADEEAPLQLENDHPCHATRIMQYLQSQKINKPGYSINLVNGKYNADLLTSFLEDNTPTLENIKRFLRDQVLYNVFLVYDAQSSYSRTSPNGLCFFNALYQAIHRFLHPDSFDKVPAFPRCEDYIKLFKHASNIECLAEVVNQLDFAAIADVMGSFEANFDDLCLGTKRNGFKWGILKYFAYALSLFPQSKEPFLFFNLFGIVDETSDQPIQVSKLDETFFSLLGDNTFTFREFEAVISINNFIFYHAGHYWLPKETIPASWSAEECLNDLAERILEAVNNIK